MILNTEKAFIYLTWCTTVWILNILSIALQIIASILKMSTLWIDTSSSQVLLLSRSGTQISLRLYVLIYFPFGNMVTVGTGNCSWILLIKQLGKQIIKQTKGKPDFVSFAILSRVGLMWVCKQDFLVDILSTFQSPRYLTTNTLGKQVFLPTWSSAQCLVLMGENDEPHLEVRWITGKLLRLRNVGNMDFPKSLGLSSKWDLCFLSRKLAQTFLMAAQEGTHGHGLLVVQPK